MKKIIRLPLLVKALLLLSLCSCSIIIDKQTSSLADSLSSAILDNDDLDTVKDGAPAFLLMLDGLIYNSPESIPLLSAGAELNAAYASAFVVDEQRQQLMLNKAKKYASNALCSTEKLWCKFDQLSLVEIKTHLADIDSEQADVLYTYASTWVSWIQANSGDWLAISHLPKIKMIFQRLSETDPEFKDGAVFMYLGGMETLIPPAMGGKPEIGKSYFERANQLSSGKNLMAQVLLAEKYARMVFDQQLHDQVLKRVLAAEPRVPGYTLMNVMAQQKAKQLLSESSDYF